METRAYLDSYTLITLFTDLKTDSLHVFNDNNEIEFKIENKDDKYIITTIHELDLNKKINLVLNGNNVPIELRHIFKLKQFDDEFTPDVNTLGSFYSKEKTVFRIWAPFKDSVTLVLDSEEYPLKKTDKGVWELTVIKNCDGDKYRYLLKENNVIEEIIDPFSYVKDKEGKNSFVVDISKLKKDKIVPSECNMPIIYELNCRDFSSLCDSFVHKKKLLAFKEDALKLDGKSIGIDYIKELGVSHVQIMPLLDFDDDNSEYNWGYNPVGYNTFKEIYFEEENPYLKIQEFKDVVNNFHFNNIRIIMDVVFNHVYLSNTFILNKLLPNYFYRYSGDFYSDGAGLGNELRTESLFLSSYICLMCKRLVDIYDIDGLRFDLSGLIDKETANKIRESILSIKKDFITIGEGWNMGNTLSDKDKCILENANDIPGYLFFNPRFKRTVIGEDDYRGFCLGEDSLRDGIKEVFASYNYSLDYKQSLNYSECHDGYTSFDYINRLCEEPDDLKIKRAKLVLGMTLLSKGIPFIHAGQEFLRSKQGIRNTYNSPDSINGIDWNLRVKNNEIVEYTKELIKLRKMLSKYYSYEIVGFEDYFELIVLNVDEIKVFINACPFDHIYNKDKEFRTIFDGEKVVDFVDRAVNIKAYSIAVAKSN